MGLWIFDWLAHLRAIAALVASANAIGWYFP